PGSKTSIGPDQHARIQAAAAALQRRQKEQEREREATNGRRSRLPDNNCSVKTNSVMTMQTAILSEASPAMKWANNYDKDAVRSAYLSNSLAGTGLPAGTLRLPTKTSTRQAPASPTQLEQKPMPALPAPAMDGVDETAAAASPAPASPAGNSAP